MKTFCLDSFPCECREPFTRECRSSEPKQCLLYKSDLANVQYALDIYCQIQERKSNCNGKCYKCQLFTTFMAGFKLMMEAFFTSGYNLQPGHDTDS